MPIVLVLSCVKDNCPHVGAQHLHVHVGEDVVRWIQHSICWHTMFHDHRVIGLYMVTTILGRKIGMTQVWDENDNVVPVTVIQAGPCIVSQVKTKSSDGYDAIQIGFGEISSKHVNKPMEGHFKAHNVEPLRHLCEVRVENGEEHACGDTITVKDFADATAVDVTGVSKGKGFQGTIKRWNFSSGPKAHGSRNQREPGSIGQCAYPGRVRKGLHMAGHMGDERITVKNLKLVRIDEEQNLLLVKGAVPGGKNALLTIRMA